MLRIVQTSSAFLLGLLPIGVAARAATFHAAPRIDTARTDCGIQAVIDEAAAAGGGTVVLPVGRFPLGRSLVLRTGVTLAGQGPGTVLAAALDEHRAAVPAGLAKDSTTLVLQGDLSTLAPGKYPGVLITAIWADASTSGAVVRHNVIESTLDEPTQWIGIEEVHVRPMKGREERADPVTGMVLVDGSTIEGNRVMGHKTADVVVRGRSSRATGNEGRMVEERP